MDALEIQNKRSGQHERMGSALRHLIPETLDQLGHVLRCSERGHRAIAHCLLAVRTDLEDEVVLGLPAACLLLGVAIHLAVPPLDQMGREFDAPRVHMDLRKHVAVAGHLLLGAVPRLRTLQHQRVDPAGGHGHPFDTV